MGEREQSETSAGYNQPFQWRLVAVLRFDCANEEIKRTIEEQKNEHLRQTGKRVLPHRVAKQNQPAPEQREMLIEQAARGEKQNADRGEEKQDRHRRDRFVSNINNRARVHLPKRFYREQRDRIDQGRQRRVV